MDKCEGIHTVISWWGHLVDVSIFVAHQGRSLTGSAIVWVLIDTVHHSRIRNPLDSDTLPHTTGFIRIWTGNRTRRAEAELWTIGSMSLSFPYLKSSYLLSMAWVLLFNDEPIYQKNCYGQNWRVNWISEGRKPGADVSVVPPWCRSDFFAIIEFEKIYIENKARHCYWILWAFLEFCRRSHLKQGFYVAGNPLCMCFWYVHYCSSSIQVCQIDGKRQQHHSHAALRPLPI